MKESFKLGGILLTITLIAGLLLGFVNNLTKDAIIENSKISKEDLNIILPVAEGIRDTDIEINEEGNVKEVYEAIKGNDIVGYVFKVSGKGFHGPVDFVVAISSDDKISGIRVLAHSETPGLGAKIEEDKFTSRFSAKPATYYLEAIKATPNKDYQVEAISGATVSSKAAVKAVNDVIAFYNEFIKGNKLEGLEETDVNTGASGAESNNNDTNTGASSMESNKEDTNTGASSLESNKTDSNTGASSLEENSSGEIKESSDVNTSASSNN